MDATILGFIALAAGALWKALPVLQKWIPWQKLVPTTVVNVTTVDSEKINRLEALKYAELVLQYLEQNDLEEGQDALREVVAILFSTPDKE